MKIRILILGLLALLVGAAPAVAASSARSGHLDASFGTGGRLILPPASLGRSGEPGARAKLLALGQGRFLLVDGNRIFSFEKSGALNPGFGDGGRVTLRPPAGETLEATDATVDPQGRILISATTSTPGAPVGDGLFGNPEFPPTRAAVVRLLPDGRPDPSFGTGGIVESTLGLSRPETPNGSYPSPLVDARAISSDPSGRPILTGSWTAQVILCYPAVSHDVTRSYVARFDPNGALETVDVDGPAGGARWGAALTPAGGGRVLFQGYQGIDCPRGDSSPPASSVALLDSAGAVEPEFAATTVAFFGLDEVPSAAIDGRGRSVISGSVDATPGGDSEGGDSEGGDLKTLAIRLRADGAPDPSFGHGGQAEVGPSSAAFGPVAVDADNRPVLAGGLLAEGKGGISLTRLTVRGAKDNRFNRGGIAQIPFSAASSAEADSVMVDGAGMVVAASHLTLRRHQYAKTIGIVRYVPGDD